MNLAPHTRVGRLWTKLMVCELYFDLLPDLPVRFSSLSV